MADDRQHDDAVDQFWDALSNPNDTPPVGNLEPDQAETLRRLHAMTRMPPPARARTRVDRMMHDRLTVPHNGSSAATLDRTTLLAGGPPHSNTLAPVPPSLAGTPISKTRTWRDFRWAGVLIATALLVLVTLGVGYLAVRPGATSTLHLAALPALEMSVIDEQGDRTLAAITLPAGSVPSPIVGGLNHYTIPTGVQSGTEGTWVSTCCHGPRFDYIVSGTVTVRSAGPVQVLRRGTRTWESMPADTEVRVSDGDAVLLRLEDAFSVANSALSPAELVEVVLINTTISDDPIPKGWEIHHQDIHTTSLLVPDAPVTLRLQSITLEPDAHLPLPADALFRFAVSLEPDAYLVTRQDFDVQNIASRPVTAYVLTLEPAVAGTSSLEASSLTPTDTARGTPSR